MSMMIFWASIGVLAIVPLYFVWNAVYNDGVVGRVALLSISFFAWSFVIDAVVAEVKYTILRQTVLLVASFAIFLVWHLWRFHRRMVRRRSAVVVESTADRRKIPDRRFAA